MSLTAVAKIFIIGNVLLMGGRLCVGGQVSALTPTRIQAADAMSDSMESFFPERVDKFTRMGSTRAYTKDTLYEHIDGHAEYFISAGFGRLLVGNYSASGAEDSIPDVIVEIYDMNRDIQAFGVLSDESNGEARESSQGSFGTDNAQGVNFTRGRYFIKILSFNAEAPVKLFQEQVSRKIGSGNSEIPEFSRFPDVGEVIKTRFVRESYRGLSFLKDVLERRYVFKGKSFDIAMVLGNRDQIRETTESFMKHFDQSDIKYFAAERNGRIVYQVKDPYEGDWLLIPLSDVIFGVYGDVDDAVITKILNSSTK